MPDLTGYGITSVGVNRPTAATMRELIEGDFISIFGPDLAIGPEFEGSTVANGLAGILTELVLVCAWELLEDIVNNLTPEGASEYMLANLKSMVATYRRHAQYSTVPLRLGTNGEVDVPIAAGAIFSKSSDGTQWVTNQDCVIPAEGTIDVPGRSLLKGPYSAAAGTINTIVTVYAGLDSITNPVDAEVGRNSESDEDLRPRVEKRGSSPPKIRSELLKVAGVTYASVRSNPVSATGPVNGLDPGDIECWVLGGSAAAIAACIYENKSSVAGTKGDEYYDITDSEGNTERIFYNIPDTTQVHVIISFDTDSNYPVDGDAQVKAKIAAKSATFVEGGTLITWLLGSDLESIPGIVSQPEILVGLSDPPVSSANLEAGPNEKFAILTANVDVNP